MSGQMMIAASMRSIGTSMIIVSLSANLIGTLATAQEIISTARRAASPARRRARRCDDGEVDRIHSDRCASGCRMVPKMMIAGIASRKQPNHQEHEGDEEPCRGDTHPPRGDVVEQRPRNLVVGEQPAEGGRRPHAEERHRGEPSRSRRTNRRGASGSFAVHEDRQRDRVQHGHARGFRRREPAEEHAADDDRRPSATPGSRSTPSRRIPSASRADRPGSGRSSRTRAPSPSAAAAISSPGRKPARYMAPMKSRLPRPTRSSGSRAG